jgi:hypothetical protein
LDLHYESLECKQVISRSVAGQYDNDALNSQDGVSGNDSLNGGAGTDTKVTDATEKSIIGFP